MRNKRLCIVVPCYNEESVLPSTSVCFGNKLKQLINAGKISDDSFILFVDDGSKDSTWQVIKTCASKDKCFQGVALSRNRGHQNALLCGLMEVMDSVDVAVSIDCDGQDDINVIDAMLEKHALGAEIVYGVRKRRDTDTWFKRMTAESFYRVMQWLGAEIVFNHADYRLTSSRVLHELAEFGEVNLFLRGLFPLVGFRSETVHYDRVERIAGESHYPLLKMLGLAADGITSLSIKPIRVVLSLGIVTATFGFAMVLWCLFSYLSGRTVPGWTSMVTISAILGGVQLVSIGVVGEYVGKVYLETKHRPRFIVAERTSVH